MTKDDKAETIEEAEMQIEAYRDYLREKGIPKEAIDVAIDDLPRCCECGTRIPDDHGFGHVKFKDRTCCVACRDEHDGVEKDDEPDMMREAKSRAGF